jgi:hypothetical protein
VIRPQFITHAASLRWIVLSHVLMIPYFRTFQPPAHFSISAIVWSINGLPQLHFAGSFFGGEFAGGSDGGGVSDFFDMGF